MLTQTSLKILDKMRNGARLVKQHAGDGVKYYLTDGQEIDTRTARYIQQHPQVMRGGDGLWGEDQSWGFE